MEFFLEMLFTAFVALLFSFIVAKLVSVATAGNVGVDSSFDQVQNAEIGVFDDLFVEDELRFGMKMDARVMESEMNFGVVDENVEHVDRFGSEVDRVDELQEADREIGNISTEVEELVVLTSEAESIAVLTPVNVIAEEEIVRGHDEQSDSAETINEKFVAESYELIVQTMESESTAALSPGNVIAEEMTVRDHDERSDSAEQINGNFGAESDVLMVQTTEADSTASASPEIVVAEEIIIQRQEEQSESREERRACLENEGNEDVKEVRVEESNTMEEIENKMELNTEEEKKELSIEEEEDDDWEGIERTELDKAFATAAKYLEESKKGEEIGTEAKMKLYGLHKIVTEGSCRETQPMAVMVSARAKWNAWQKLGNMSQEEAMEQYLALLSKEIPDFMNTGHPMEKIAEMENSAVLPTNPGSLEGPTTLDTPSVASSKNG